MKTFIVNVREVHVAHVRVKADSEDQAIDLVRDGEGDYLDRLDYSETLDSDTWKAFEE